jgi:hypothetical protein
MYPKRKDRGMTGILRAVAMLLPSPGFGRNTSIKILKQAFWVISQLRTLVNSEQAVTEQIICLPRLSRLNEKTGLGVDNFCQHLQSIATCR